MPAKKTSKKTRKQTAIQNILLVLEDCGKLPAYDKHTIDAIIEYTKPKLQEEKQQFIDLLQWLNKTSVATFLHLGNDEAIVSKFMEETYNQK